MASLPTIRRLLLFEAVTFAVAALTHFGVLMSGGEHRKAGIAESVIGGVLLVGLASTYIRPAAARALGAAAQGFALLGTLVGILTIAVGIGPRTVPDVLYHIGIVAVLATGLAAAVRTRP